jgi:hypothetical protein
VSGRKPTRADLARKTAAMLAASLRAHVERTKSWGERAVVIPMEDAEVLLQRAVALCELTVDEVQP